MNNPNTRPALPWFWRSAQQLADENQQPTYIVTRMEDFGPTDVILFAHELEDVDLENVKWGFPPTPQPLTQRP